MTNYEEFQLADDGTLDTVIIFRGAEFRFSDTSLYRDQTGMLDMERFMDDHADSILEDYILMFPHEEQDINATYPS